MFDSYCCSYFCSNLFASVNEQMLTTYFNFNVVDLMVFSIYYIFMSIECLPFWSHSYGNYNLCPLLHMWFLNRRVLFVNQWLIDNRRKANWHFCIFCLILCQFRCSVGIRKFRESVSGSRMAVKIQHGRGEGDRRQKMERGITANKKFQ